MTATTAKRGRKAAAHHERIYAALRADILAKRLSGGEKLLEADLARRFRVSRTPVREALYKLERDGLVTRAVNVGVTVAKSTTDSIGQYLAVLTLLESEAARQWAETPSMADDLRELEALQDTMKVALRDKHVDAYEDANRAFHALVLSRCPNVYLRDLVDSTRQKMFTLSLESFPSALHIEQYIEDHDRILQSAREGGPEAVVAAFREHLDNIGRNIRGAA